MADPKRYSLIDGGWVEFGPMTGADFLTLRDIMRRREGLTDDDVEAIVHIFKARVVGTSEPDVMEIPLSELLGLTFGWYVGVDEAAVPTPTGTD